MPIPTSQLKYALSYNNIDPISCQHSLHVMDNFSPPPSPPTEVDPRFLVIYHLLIVVSSPNTCCVDIYHLFVVPCRMNHRFLTSMMCASSGQQQFRIFDDEQISYIIGHTSLIRCLNATAPRHFINDDIIKGK